METRRDVFQAIADPTRRAILLLVASQSMTPNAIAEHFDSSRQAISKHLKVLNECELIQQESKGRERLYHVNAQKVKEIDNWVKQFEAIWTARFNQLDEILKNIQQP
jgi:DNA-binding transcriptional ArsR family regulator